MTAPLIDPVEHIRRIGDEALGVVPMRVIVTGQERLRRFDAESDRTQRLLTFETMEVHAFNVPANASTTMAHLLASAATTTKLVTFTPDVPGQCRAVALRLLSDAAITAGTCMLRLAVFEGADSTNYDFAECALSAIDNRIKSLLLAWDNAPQVAKNATWYLVLVTDAGFLPAGSVNIKAHITWGYEQWV